MIYKIFRVIVLVVLLAVVGVVIWMRATPEGRDAAHDLSNEWQDVRHGGEARDAAQKLRAMKAMMAKNNPSDPNYITLGCTDLTLGDEGFNLIAKCVQLQEVSLIDTDINDDRAKNLSNLKRLTSLSITKTSARKDAGTVSDAGIQCVASMPELVGLLVSGTNIGDEGLKTIGKLPELATLDLRETRVTDAGMPALTGLSKLQWLVLSDTAVGDDGVAKLQGLPSLRQLSLKGSKVTAKGRAQLRKMYPELTID